MTTLPSVCPLDCPDRCSLSVDVEQERIQRIGGSALNPLTVGTGKVPYICKKVEDFGERAYGKQRILHPMRRVGPKGSGRWEQISWESALSEIASRFQQIRDTHGGEAILPCWYAGSNGYLTGGGMDFRFWHRLGAARLERTLCAANTGKGTRSVYGDLPSTDISDVIHTKLLIVWGCNPRASGIHLLPLIKQVQKNGGTLIVVDPRRTSIAEKADLALAPLPGTDVALALCLAGLAFEEGWAATDFLEKWSEDAEAFEREARSWTVEKTALVCGLKEEEIRKMARMYAESNPALLRCGWGVERNRNGTDAVRAILSLPAVYGKFGVKGGGYAMSTSGGYKAAIAPLQRHSLGHYPARSVNLSLLATSIETCQNPPIQALYVYDCNPVATVPDQARLLQNLAREELFVVVHEQVWTDTCDWADIVLPATTFLEHRELNRSYSSYILQWAEPVIPPVGESRNNHQVFVALAEAMGLGDAETRMTEEALAEAIMEAIPAGKGRWPELKEKKVLLLPHPIQFVDAFPSKKLRFTKDENDIPIGPPSDRPPPADAHLPLILISPAEARAISSTGFESLQSGSATLKIHAVDAAQRQIQNGDLLRVSNSCGEMQLFAEISEGSDGVRPGVVSTPKGLWRSATRNGFTSNALVPSYVDPLGGGACYNDARVEVERM